MAAMTTTQNFNQFLQEQATPRSKRVYEEHQAGRTFKEIAADIGISSERARQLATRYARQHQLPYGRD